MTEPRDEISCWLDTPVEPLAPPPGTYERIRQRARRRRRRRVAGAAVTAAVLAAAVAVPQVASTLFNPAGAPSQRPSAAAPAASSPAPQPSNVLPSAPGTNSGGPPVPNGFAPVSATFVGLGTGWVLGTVAAPCPATGCLALARTDDTGASWHGVPAPRGLAAGPGGVSGVRFLNLDDGWLFGSQLWWTRDAGSSWQQVNTGGRQVVSLEAAGDRAFAVFADCAAAGPAPAGGGVARGCSSYQLMSAVAGTPTWAVVPGATSGSGTGTVVLTGHTGYLVATSGAAVTLSGGSLDGSAWHALATPCPSPPGAKAATGARGALLATASGAGLFAVCTAGPADGPQAASQIVTSADGGRSWQVRSAAPIPGTAWSAAVNPGGGVALLATSTGLYLSADGGTSWRTAVTGPPGGFSFAGMTDVLQGFAVAAQPGQHGLLITTDGGQSWHAAALSSAP